MIGVRTSLRRTGKKIETKNNKAVDAYRASMDMRKAMVDQGMFEKTHSGEYRCLFEGCGKEFEAMYNLSSHMLVHTDERPHSCERCTATFTRRHDLLRHLRN
ncbi:hypothetical protein HDV05_002947, partial [Chytridiales sp. JEL 0842]